MLTNERTAREDRSAAPRSPHDVARRPLDLVVQRRTCTHCGAYTWFAPDDLSGSWYRCDRCGAMA